MKLNPRMQIILTALGVVVVLAVFFFFFIHSRQGELSDARDAVTAEQAKTAQLETELARLHSIRANAPKLRAALAKLRAAVPRSDGVPEVIVAIQDAADKAGIKFVQVTPSVPAAPPEGGQLGQVPAAIGAEGSYFALQDFVNRLYALDRALRIDTLTMSNATDAAATTGTTTATTGPVTIRLDVTARMFFEPPKGAEPAPAPDAAAVPVG